jgi:hypothetical protein
VALASAWLAAATGLAAVDPESIVVKDLIHFSDIQNREPMVAELADGRLLVTGFPRYPHEPPRAPSLWRSGDGGKNWSRVEVGSPDEGAVGNSDTDLAVAPDGTVYFVSMGFDRSKGRGTHIAIGSSTDHGKSWSWTTLSRAGLEDRPWVEVAADGTAHVIWNDGKGVHHATSRDQGKTWQRLPKVHDKGGSSHLALGPDGEIAVRISPLSASGNQLDLEVDLIAVSLDGGTSWTKQDSPGATEWGPLHLVSLPRWVEPLAWNSEGNLYHLWSEGLTMRLGRTTDLGATWKIWTIAEDEDTCFYPYLVRTAEGELAATWFAAADGMSVRVALIGVAGDQPRVIQSERLRFESWMEAGDNWVRDTAGEYVPVMRLSDGDLALVTPLQDPRNDRMGFSFWRLALEPSD